MLDNPFRQILPPYVDAVLKLFRLVRLTPNHITWLSFVVALAAAGLILSEQFLAAIVVWWISRLLDACEGIYARKYGMSSRLGAFLDVQLDMAAYSLVVLALFRVFPELALQWCLMLFSYVLCISGALSLGHFERQINLPDRSGRGLRLASGLAEGGETGLAYSVFLLFPEWLSITTWIWIGVLGTTVLARMGLAYRELGGD